MKKIAVKDIKDTMVVSRDICGLNGNVLVTKGSVISTSIGRRLETWGISTIYVEGTEETKPEVATVSESPDILHQLLCEKFSNVIENPLMKKIFDAVYKFRLSKNS